MGGLSFIKAYIEARILILKASFLSDDRTPSFKEDMISVIHYSIALALAIFTTFI